MHLNMLKNASPHVEFHQVARAELVPGSHNEWHRSGCPRSAGSLDSTVNMSHISKTKFFVGMLSATLWCGLSNIIGMLLMFDITVEHSTTSLPGNKFGAKHLDAQLCGSVCATNELEVNFEVYRPIDIEFKMNALVKMLLMMCECVVVNLLRLNFHLSIIAATLMRYLRSERIYMIGAARFVRGRRHRLQRRRVWRYTTWRQKCKSTNFTHYFLVTRSWVKTLHDEIRYVKESFSTWIKTTKYFHHDDPPANVVAQGSLDFEYMKKADSSATFDECGLGDCEYMHNDHLQLSGVGNGSVEKWYYEAPVTVWRQKQKKRKKRRGRIGEASHPGPGRKVTTCNSPRRLRSPSPKPSQRTAPHQRVSSTLCRFFLKDRCKKGDECLFTHSTKRIRINSPPPVPQHRLSRTVVTEPPSPPPKPRRATIEARPPTPPKKPGRAETPPRSMEALPPSPPKKRLRAATPPKASESKGSYVERTSGPRFAKTAEEIKEACDVFDRWFTLGSEAQHCDKFPQYFELDGGWHRCLICDKMATQAHLNTKRHQKAFERPDQYGMPPHDASMPWPRDDDTRWMCLKVTQDNSYMTVEKAEAIRYPPKEDSKEKPGPDRYMKQFAPKKEAKKEAKIEDKKETVKNEPVMHLRTIFNDADDNPMTYLKITMLERRLKVKKITNDEFHNQHPRGAKYPRRAGVAGQAIWLKEYAVIRNVTSIPALNGAVALITDYVDGYYSAALMGAHRGQHVDDLRQAHLELIKEDEWPQLFDEDQLLHWDVRGIDEGAAFPNRTRIKSASL